MLNRNPLTDEEFLKQLQEDNAREVYARITALTKDELPIETIEGRVCDGGNISVDGTSTVRRTCNMTLTAEDVNINEFYWGIKTKIKVEIGLRNLINSNYPDIIWFKQGLFVLTSFSTTQTTNKWTIKITAKDKMCLLNGDLAGHLPHETDFGKEEYHDLETDTVTYTEVPVKNIIRNAVQEFGGELPQNIIINDLDDLGLELLEYRSTTPMFLYKETASQEYKNMVMFDTAVCYYTLPKEISIEKYNLIPIENELRKKYILDDMKYVFKGADEERENYQGTIGDEFTIVYDTLQTGLETLSEEPTEIKFKIDAEEKYVLAKLTSGDMPGYFVTDLTYAGDLIANIGETITSVLDKIKNMLTNFEYYYDVDGRFIFQKKKEYITMAWNNTDTTDTVQYQNTSVENNLFMYSFIDGKLVTSFQNTPKINEIKNDYSVWGKYTSDTSEIPIHMRYAIDKKPTSYQPIRPLKEEIVTTIKDSITGKIITSTTTYKYYDAPEVEPYNEECLEKKEPSATEGTEYIDNLHPSLITVDGENGTIQITKRSLYFAKVPYTTEKTEYRDPVDWRELIYQMALDYRKCHNEDDFTYWIAQANPEYPSGRTSYEQYYIDLEGFWRTLYDPNPSLTYVELQPNEVSTYTTLIDDTEANDLYDNIYIKNGLRPIAYNEFKQDIWNPEALYIYDEKGLRDWKTSEWCCLELDQNYYVEGSDTMQQWKPASEESTDYKELVKVDIDDVLMKLSREFFTSAETMGLAGLHFKVWSKGEQVNTQVLNHLSYTSYKDSQEDNDYVEVVQNKFDTYFEDWDNFANCYVFDSGYVKLTDSDFFDYYYYTYLYRFQKFIEEIIEKINEEEDFDIESFSTYNTLLNDFGDKINDYYFKDLKTSYETLLQDIPEKVYEAALKLLRIYANYWPLSVVNDEKSTYYINSVLYNLLGNLCETLFVKTKDEEGNEIITDKVIDFDTFVKEISGGTLRTALENIVKEIDFCSDIINLKIYEGGFDINKKALAEEVQTILAKYENSNIWSYSHYKNEVPAIYVEKEVNGQMIEDEEKSMTEHEYDYYYYIPCLALYEFVKNNILYTQLLSAYSEVNNYFNTANELFEIMSDAMSTDEIWDADASIKMITEDGIIILPELYEILQQDDNEDNLYAYLKATKMFQDTYYYSKYNNFGKKLDEKNSKSVSYYWGDSDYAKDAANGNFWNETIDISPQKLLFWFDFLEPTSTELEKISVPVIGQRTKVVNDSNVKAVHYKDIPNVIFRRTGDNSETEIKSGYTYININKNTENYFSISSKGKSANERIEELLYTNGYCPENITVQTIPVYHLEPNHHIYIQDLKSGIQGEYMVNKITIPLSYNKTMSITASKVVNSIT